MSRVEIRDHALWMYSGGLKIRVSVVQPRSERKALQRADLLPGELHANLDQSRSLLQRL